MRGRDGPGGLVYSTDGGRMCPSCRQPTSACRCTVPAAVSRSADGVVRVALETAGRGGKTVTVVRGLGLPAEALVALGKRLRAACGTGGTNRDGVLELQGDHGDRVLALLAQEGHTVRRAGKPSKC